MSKERDDDANGYKTEDMKRQLESDIELDMELRYELAPILGTIVKILTPSASSQEVNVTDEMLEKIIHLLMLSGVPDDIKYMYEEDVLRFGPITVYKLLHKIVGTNFTDYIGKPYTGAELVRYFFEEHQKIFCKDKSWADIIHNNTEDFQGKRLSNILTDVERKLLAEDSNVVSDDAD